MPHHGHQDITVVRSSVGSIKRCSISGSANSIMSADGGLPLMAVNCTQAFQRLLSTINIIISPWKQSHTVRTLDALQSALDTFHAHKQVFVDMNIREHFNIYASC
jgi:hypothetical protein